MFNNCQLPEKLCCFVVKLTALILKQVKNPASPPLNHAYPSQISYSKSNFIPLVNQQLSYPITTLSSILQHYQAFPRRLNLFWPAFINDLPLTAAKSKTDQPVFL